jgi:hypothetical protein
MRTRLLILLTAALAVALAAAAVATAHEPGGHGHKAKRLRSTPLAKSAWLTGKAEVGADGRRGAGDPDAVGTAIFQLIDDKTICYGFALDNADAPMIVHIHRGAAGHNGPPVIAFANVPKDVQGQPAGDPGTSSGCKVLTTPDELAALKDLRAHPRDFYVNMHTATFPNGAVRGQLSNLQFSNR